MSGYQRINFKDQVVERPKTYDVTNNSDGSITLIDSFGNVEELGTPINSETMGHIEDALEEHDGRITVLENASDYDNFLNKSQITNCITEIPQRVRLDLTDGTLNLKAGSVVIVPYGTEDLTSQYPVGATFINDNFKVYDTQFADGKFFVWAELVGDISRQRTTTDASERILNVYINISTLDGAVNHGSGTSSPSDTCLFYNTSTNKVEYFTSGVNSGGLSSLPFGLCVADGTNVFASIRQIFNGMGYIGSTVWVDKGVKGLIPNGRKEDGTLNNNEVMINKLSTVSVNGTRNAYIVISSLGVAIPTVAEWSYDEQNNYNIQNGNPKQWSTVGNMYMQTGVITSFSVKQPFRVADYQEAVKKAGDTMTGALIIKNPENYDFTATTAPSSAIIAGTFAIADKNGNIVSRLQNYFNTYNNMITHITTNRSVGGTTKTAALQLYVDSEGLDQFVFPKCTTTPTTTSSASNSKVAVVVQNYVSGTSWYRVWSDGWKEQGGMTGTLENAGIATVAFLKAFTNTNYTVVLGTTKINQTASGTYNDFVKTKTASNFTVVSGSGGNASCAWYACGY